MSPDEVGLDVEGRCYYAARERVSAIFMILEKPGSVTHSLTGIRGAQIPANGILPIEDSYDDMISQSLPLRQGVPLLT